MRKGKGRKLSKRGQLNRTNPVSITHFTLANDLEVICLPLDYADYVSLNLVMPSGVIHDPSDESGSALLLAELLGRGAGNYDSRSLLTAFDDHGIRHGESASLLHTSLRSSFLPGELENAFGLLSSMILEPHFPEEALEPVKSLFLHDIRSIQENPSRWAMMELSNRYFPAPYDRSILGDEKGILSVTRDSLVEHWKTNFGPKGAVLSLAGNFDLETLRGTIEAKLGGWSGESLGAPVLEELPAPASFFIDVPGSQQHLVLRAPSAVMESKSYYVAKVFSQILSGGMFGRLFVEVREKRGLCYTVFGQHSARKDYGSFTIYAGTTPERVHETHQVIVDIMQDPLKELTEQELQRAKNNLLSQIVLSEESTNARSRRTTR